MERHWLLCIYIISRFDAFCNKKIGAAGKRDRRGRKAPAVRGDGGGFR